MRIVSFSSSSCLTFASASSHFCLVMANSVWKTNEANNVYLYDIFVWGIIYQLHINSKYSNLKLEKKPAQLNKMT